MVVSIFFLFVLKSVCGVSQNTMDNKWYALSKIMRANYHFFLVHNSWHDRCLYHAPINDSTPLLFSYAGATLTLRVDCFVTFVFFLISIQIKCYLISHSRISFYYILLWIKYSLQFKKFYDRTIRRERDKNSCQDYLYLTIALTYLQICQQNSTNIPVTPNVSRASRKPAFL